MNKVDEIKRQTILHEALSQINLILGLRWNVTLGPKKKEWVDHQFIINRNGKEVYRADCLVHTNFKDEHIARNLTALMTGNRIVVAENIPPNTKMLLREKEINYLDINGNCFITDEKNRTGIFLYLEGQKNAEHRNEKKTRAFTKAGLKVVYQFLLTPDLINGTYREIAEKAGVAIGNIKQIIDGLHEEGFLVRKNKNEFAFIKTADLVDRWTKAYGERLKPALEIGTFRLLNPNDFINWKDIHLDTKKTCWGGEPAANLWTNYLKPGILTLYTEETRIELIKKYKLVPEVNGSIKIYRKFWNEEKKIDNKVNPILTYADLILTSDMRCLETAHMIYEKYIQKP